MLLFHVLLKALWYTIVGFRGKVLRPRSMVLPTSVSTGLKVRKPNRMKTTYQYRIYPTMKQHKTLEVWLDACRTLYNQALDMKKQAYDTHKEKYHLQNASRLFDHASQCLSILAKQAL